MRNRRPSYDLIEMNKVLPGKITLWTSALAGIFTAGLMFTYMMEAVETRKFEKSTNDWRLQNLSKEI